jgi:hypothetical protein
LINAAGIVDVISAAALVLAVLTALYTLWLPDVSAALAIVPEDDPDDRGPQRTQVSRAMWTKAVPLFLATSVTTLILVPRGLAICIEAVRHIGAWPFDDVKALFLLTLSLLLLLAIVAAVQVANLRLLRRTLG